ncbi:Virginiamycin B lyase [compost metagenome]
MLVNLVSGGHCFKLTRKGDFFQDPTPLAPSLLGTKKSMASFADGTLWIAVMAAPTGGKLVKIDPNGVETAFDTPDTPIYLASGPGNHLFVPSRNLNAVLVFNAHGEIVERIPVQEPDSISGIFVDTAGTIYLSTFYNGKVIRLERTEGGYTEQCIASGLGILGGIAADSNDRLFVSDFTGDSIWMLP